MYMALFGQYILTSKIFDVLEETIESDSREQGEFELTPCLDRLRREDGFIGYVVKGRSYDIGVPEKYRQTVIEFGDR